MSQTLCIDSPSKMFTTKFVIITVLLDSLAVVPCNSTCSASSFEAIYVGIGKYLTTLAGKDSPFSSL